MKFRGGYNVLLKGRPSGEVVTLPEPEALHLPLHSRRFRFSELLVEEGEQVGAGHLLAWTVARDEPHPINAPFTLERFSTGQLIDEAAAAAVAH